jgi:hypothetical protein
LIETELKTKVCGPVGAQPPSATSEMPVIVV